MEKITSSQNALIKVIMELRDSHERQRQKRTIIDGPREIQRAHEAGAVLEKVFYVQGRHDALVKRLTSNKVEAIEVNERVCEKLAYGQRDEGIIAVARTPERSLKDLKLSSQPLLIVLESLEKPGNLGAILRTADAIGVEAVLVCDPKTDIFNPNVIRSSTGVVFSLPVICGKREDIFAFLKARRIKMCALTPQGAKVYTHAHFKGSWAFVLGSEDQGLSDFWLVAADQTVKIPMKGRADSLNVATSAAIILYEALRQRA